MENFSRLATGLNVTPLLTAIWRQPELWAQITARQTTPGSPHKDTETIFLRWAEDRSIDAVFNHIPAVDYPALDSLPEALPLINELLHLVGGKELGRVIITKLKPKGAIDPHIDEGKYADHYERFHIALQSDLGAWFQASVSDHAFESVHMKAGDAWWFNHKREHSYINEGETDRIHLIVDCVAPNFRRERDAQLCS